MRLLFYTISSRDAIGGAEHVLSAQAEGLRERGHDVTTIYTEPEADLSDPDRRRWALPLSGVETRWKIPTVSSIVRAAGSLLRLARCLRMIRPDIVNVHYVDVRTVYFVVLRPLFQYRLVLTAHGSDVLQPFSRVNRAALPYLLRFADAVIAVSNAVATGIEAVAPEAASRVTVVENGVDLSFWTPSADTEQGPPRVVQVGRLSRVKGQDLLITAFREVLNRHPEVRLELIGDGVWRHDLEALVASLGIEESVAFLGALPPEEVRERLRTARAAVLPSRSEGLPLSLLEAFGTGVPTVAASVGGVPAAAGEPPACLLVAPESPHELAAAICRVLADPGLATTLRERARRRVQAFSIDRQVEQTEAIMECLL